jgi:hypothetical protein
MFWVRVLLCFELTFLTHHHHVTSLSPFTLQQINGRLSYTNFQFSPPYLFTLNCLRYVKNTQVRDLHRYILFHLLAYIISECVTHGKCSFWNEFNLHIQELSTPRIKLLSSFTVTRSRTVPTLFCRTSLECYIFRFILIKSSVKRV